MVLVYVVCCESVMFKIHGQYYYSSLDFPWGRLVEAWVGTTSSKAQAHQTLTLGSNPNLIRSIMADHMWKMDLPAAMPITATHK